VLLLSYSHLPHETLPAQETQSSGARQVSITMPCQSVGISRSVCSVHDAACLLTCMHVASSPRPLQVCMCTVKAHYNGPLCPHKNRTYKREVFIIDFHFYEDLSCVTSLVRMFELLHQDSRKAINPPNEAGITISIEAKLITVSNNKSCSNALTFTPFLFLR
jgi:hypothetical protein